MGKILEFPLLDTIKITFRMINLTERWTHNQDLFSKIRAFAIFLEKG